MGLFAGARKMFDGKPGSPFEDFLRSRGLMPSAPQANWHIDSPEQQADFLGGAAGTAKGIGAGLRAGNWLLQREQARLRMEHERGMGAFRPQRPFRLLSRY